jgi:hypothetical protein
MSLRGLEHCYIYLFRCCVLPHLAVDDAANSVFLCEKASQHGAGVATGYRLQATGYRLQATVYRLQATGYRLQSTGYRLQATGYSLQALKGQASIPGRAR